MRRVLLVEDNQIFRKTFKENLGRHFPSLIIEEAVDGEEALQKVKGGPPDFIITDLRLPGINGLQLAEKLKKTFPNIPIAILSGYDLPEYKQAALQYGVNHFFVKESLRWEEIEGFLGPTNQIT